MRRTHTHTHQIHNNASDTCDVEMMEAKRNIRNSRKSYPGVNNVKTDLLLHATVHLLSKIGEIVTSTVYLSGEFDCYVQ